LELSDKVPDAKTIWKFRNDLSCAGVAYELFTVFNQLLKSEGLITHKGSIIDSTFERFHVSATAVRKTLKLKKVKYQKIGKPPSRSIVFLKRIWTLVGRKRATVATSGIRTT